MTHRWYVLHVYSGFEKKVASSIKEQAEQKGMMADMDLVALKLKQTFKAK